MALSLSLSPASSPSFSLPPPQQPIASPFPSDSIPPSLPPVTSPPADRPLLPPEAESSVSPPPPPPPLPLVPEFPPPSPAPVPVPAIVATPPPSESPLLPASPPPPEFASPPVPTESPPVQPSPVIATPPPEAPEITVSPPSVVTPPAPSSTTPSVPSTPSIITPPPEPSPPSIITPPRATSPPSTITPSVPSSPSIIPAPAQSILTPPAPLTPATTTTTTPSPDSVALPTPATASSSSENGGFPAAVQIRNPGQKTRVSPGFVAGIAVVSLVVVLVVVVACVVYGKRQRRRSKKRSSGLPQYYYYHNKKAPSLGPKDNMSTMATLHSPTKTTLGMSTTTTSSDSGQAPPPSQGVFTYDQLAEATEYFSEANLLGEGGFGRVYRGVLAGGGKEVAVKQLGVGSRQGEREFRAEVDIITRIHHKHLVSLVGYCITGAERLLVYEFMPNNTLEFHLHENHSHVMDWATRLRIAVGAAKGLAYLHEDCNPKIIHRDIKASNILLDFRFEAKVSDFGLAKSLSDTSTHTSHISTRVVGTFGYLAPEYASSGKVTEKSDVYSYGVMLLELITGKPPICSIDPLTNQGIVEWARPLLVQAMDSHDLDTLVDPRLGRNYDAVQMSRTVSCAAACVRHSAWLRPRMSQIVHALEGHATLTDLHEGITPGNSTQYGCPSSSYDACEYRSDLNRFHRTIADQEYSGSTSEYGLNPSVSSGEASQRFRV